MRPSTTSRPNRTCDLIPDNDRGMIGKFGSDAFANAAKTTPLTRFEMMKHQYECVSHASPTVTAAITSDSIPSMIESR